MISKNPRFLVCFPRKFSTAACQPPPFSSLPPHPSINQTKQAHARIIVNGAANDGRFLAHLLSLLAAASSIPFHYPLSILQSIAQPSVFAINNAIRCFAKGEQPRESLRVYARMRRWFLEPNKHTFTFVLQACSKALAIIEGTQIQNHVLKLGFEEDVFVRNALIHFYCACCRVESAKRLFEDSPRCRDVVSWNSMIAGLVRDGQTDDAVKLFDEMPERDVISWSTMIMGYVHNGLLEKGLECFGKMRGRGIAPNEATLVSVLSVSAQWGLLDQGRSVHSIAESLKFPAASSLGTALIDMYAKCGCIDEARSLFDKMPHRDRCSWNAMICGLASHGRGREALELFEKFIHEGFIPENVTFIGVLNACSRAGLVSEGKHYFTLMTKEYGIEPEMEHYGCMVDLFSRAGFINDAVELVGAMNIPPDPALWATVIGACKIHGFVELGEKIGRELIQSDPSHTGHYVQLASIYAKVSKWEDVSRVRRLMVERKAGKTAGWSLIETKGRVHRFMAGDREHEQQKEIYEMLETVGRRVAEAGYRADVSGVAHDVEDEEKESSVKEHSERLAMAFGLLATKEGDCIRIVKNLRVCGDCHQVSKLISDVFRREIVVRDGSRFHHFKNGKCSCQDYW